MNSSSGSGNTAVVSILLTVTLNFSDWRRWLKVRLVHSPHFFRLVEDGDRLSQSDILILKLAAAALGMLTVLVFEKPGNKFSRT